MLAESIRVLLVEDNMGDALLLHEGLEDALPGQFHVSHARQLSEALEFLWKETFHVVLLDLGLPDSYGIDTLVLARAQAPDVPIVVLTSSQEESLGNQALKEGAQDYLVKGQVDSKMLARSMRYAIARKVVTEAVIGQGVTLALAAALRRSRRQLIAAHERVRQDIAAQLHDGVQERLHVLKDHLQLLLRGNGSASETTRVPGDGMDGLSQKLEQQVNVLSRRLYPSNLGEGLVPALRSFRDQFGAALAVEIELDEEFANQEQADQSLLSEQVRLAAYRIAEEALTNVVKHTKASKATVRLDSSRDGWLRLTIRDDGQGFDLESSPRGLGLGTMQDYAEAVDGECSVHSDPGVGTEIAAVLPLSPPGAGHPESSGKGDN